MKKNREKASSRLFSNSFLDGLTRTQSIFPILLFSLIPLGLLFYTGYYESISLSGVIGLYVLGLVVFSWFEYVVHRFVFHMRLTTKVRVRVQYLVHGVHHDRPKDKDRLAMPVLLSLLISILLLAFFYGMMGKYSFPLLAGMLQGYALYLFIHYIVHVFPPPKGYFRFLWVNHAIHHYKDDSIYFGVSSPLWDYLYGTIPVRRVR